MPSTLRRPATRRHLALAVALAVVVLGVAGWSWLRGDDQGVATASEGGAASTEQDCGPVLREPVDGAGAHIDDSSIFYSSAPPAFGDHSSRWEVRALSFYGVDDRPEVPVLVHNLEHGYNILWYDQTIVEDSDAVARVREIANGYASIGQGRDPAAAFIAVPWTTEDGDAFPDDTHYALTHWYADPADRTRSRADELGLTRYCADISVDVVQEWMDDYPLEDAPEGYPDLM